MLARIHGVGRLSVRFQNPQLVLVRMVDLSVIAFASARLRIRVFASGLGSMGERSALGRV